MRLDTAIGDGDHGTNMDRGMKAAVEKLEATEGDDIGALLKAVGMALVSKVGGAAGPAVRHAVPADGDGDRRQDRARPRRTGPTRSRPASSGVQARGKAELEDKTMIDALLPARRGAQGQGRGGRRPRRRAARSADAAEEGHDATTPLEARKGRASYLGPRCVGHQDPGATSSALLLRAAASRWG